MCIEIGTILIVDDNESVLVSLELLLENVFSTVRTTANPNQITTALSTTLTDIVILDMNFPAGINNGNEGLYWLKHIHEIHPSLPVIILTAYGDVELAVKALKNGATDFLLKSWDNRILIQKIKEAYQNNRPTHHKNSSKSVQEASGDENLNKSETLIGYSPAALQLIKVVIKVVKTDANTLITGENGAGKKMLAREIHRLSSRSTRQLLSVDMGAISESLFEGELFGHEYGVFIDAYESRPGKLEVANGGSLFVDEIGNLPLALQARLLTVLQNRNITRVGSNKVILVDIRLIPTTNKDISEMIKEGSPREDLFYRINTIHLEVLLLRERGDNLLLFIDAFLHRFAFRYQRSEIRMHERTIEKPRSYHWPSNIRGLQHTTGKAVILCEGNVIRPEDILVKQTWKPQIVQVVPNLEEVERQAIETAILQNNGNLTAVTKQPGISRQTFYNKLKRFKP